MPALHTVRAARNLLSATARAAYVPQASIASAVFGQRSEIIRSPMDTNHFDESFHTFEVVWVGRIERQVVARGRCRDHQIRSAPARLTSCRPNRRADLPVQTRRSLVVRERIKGCFDMLEHCDTSGALGRIVGRMGAIRQLTQRDRRHQHGVRQLGRLIEPDGRDDTGVYHRDFMDRHRPVPSYGSLSSWLTASSRSARRSSASIAGAVAKIARTSSVETARRRRIGVILASGSPFRVSVYARPCRRPRVTEPESETNWRMLMSVGCSSAMAEVYPPVPRRTTDFLCFASPAVARASRIAIRRTSRTGKSGRATYVPHIKVTSGQSR